MRLSVLCYADFKGEERPVRFHLDGVDHFVQEVLEQWYGPEHSYFQVRAEDGGVYVLRRSMTGEGEWSLESRRLPAH